jgi:hypothetical protein
MKISNNKVTYLKLLQKVKVNIFTKNILVREQQQQQQQKEKKRVSLLNISLLIVFIII